MIHRLTFSIRCPRLNINLGGKHIFHSNHTFACLNSTAKLENTFSLTHPHPSFLRFNGWRHFSQSNQKIKENIYTIPNLLTLSRLALTPSIGYFIIEHCYPEALAVLCIAALTDLLDGFIARRFNQGTMIGSVLDPLADKVLMTTLTVSLSTVGLVPLPLAILIIGRDIALVSGTAYVRCKSLPEPKTVGRYFDVSLPSAEVKPPLISKLNTFLQLALMAASLSSPIYGFTDNIIMDLLRYSVGITTIGSMASYWFNKSTIRVLGKDWRKGI